MDFGFTLDGAAELEFALRELPRQLAKSTLRRTLLKAAQPMVEAARIKLATANAAVVIRSGSTLSPRQASQAAKPGPWQVFVYVGAAPDRKLHLIEFGSGPRYTKAGAYRGRMPANPYMRPAFEGTAAGVLSDFSAQLGREIEATALRLARRREKAGLA